MEAKGDHAEALEVYSQIVDHWSCDRDEHIRDVLISKVPKVFDRVIQKFYESRNKKGAAQAYLDQAELLRKVSPNFAFEIYDKVIDLFSSNRDPEIRTRVGEAYDQKLRLLDCKDTEFGTVINEFVQFLLRTKLDEYSASMLLQLCDYHEEAEKYQDALALYETLIKEIDASGSSAFAADRRTALDGKAYCLSVLGRRHETIHVYTDILLDPKTDEEGTANVIRNLGIMFENIGQKQHALTHYNEVIARFGTKENFAWYVSRAMLNKAGLLDELEDAAGAIATYDLLIHQYGDSGSLIEDVVAEARLYKAGVLERNGQSAAAIAIYEALVQQYANSRKTALQRIAQQAIQQKEIIEKEIQEKEISEKARREGLIDPALLRYLYS